MKEKMIWWMQLLVNCCFFLYLIQYIDTLYNFGVIVDSIIDFILAIIALILGYALTVKFENDPNK
ncbi:MAG TPA: hypothetical protein K8V00_12260 [Ligilactobacillus acidipiscis]|uniref:Uncharacterized protein n=1 Tax=Ligilactobacillus acidipiscis TaxID=89059 RepID=A0A921K2S9_9LACO|nr:hypothetical protein [Ligilactobacillus acidipiscis]